MNINFYGGADEVGRSCIEISNGREKLIMDCGVKIGNDEEYPLMKRVPKNIIITHTHLDHAGYLPHIFRRKINRKIFLTQPTRDLMQLMIADYMRVSRNKFDNSKVLNNILSCCRVMNYNELSGTKIKFSLHNSGHILGSASVLVHSNRGNLLYTSDLNTRNSRIVNSAEQGLKAKTLIIESTYGGKDDILPPMKDACNEIVMIINNALKKNGRVLIPSFAVGRAQELILLLDSYMKNGIVEPAPIYIDGMIKKALKIFRHNVIYAKEELQRSILVSDVDPFKSKYVFIPKRRDRKDAIQEGSIIITTSGMLKGGPVKTYLKALANDKKNVLLFVGYQAAGTPGRKVLDGAKIVKLNGSEIKINMSIKNVSLSAHADHNGLMQYINKIKGLEQVFIVHGEEKKRKELAESIEKCDVILPKNGEKYRV